MGDRACVSTKSARTEHRAANRHIVRWRAVPQQARRKSEQIRAKAQQTAAAQCGNNFTFRMYERIEVTHNDRTTQRQQRHARRLRRIPGSRRCSHGSSRRQRARARQPPPALLQQAAPLLLSDGRRRGLQLPRQLVPSLQAGRSLVNTTADRRTRGQGQGVGSWRHWAGRRNTSKW